ncbi:MAG: hypothetical protein ACE5NG_19170, partial [bacterium]
RKKVRQTGLALLLSCSSPLTNYLFVSRDLSSTGLRSMGHFRRLANEYSQVFGAYIDTKFEKLRAENPTLTVNDWIDVSDRPRFQYQTEALGHRLADVLPHFGLLIFFAILFFVAAFVSFLKYDVR